MWGASSTVWLNMILVDVDRHSQSTVSTVFTVTGAGKTNIAVLTILRLIGQIAYLWGSGESHTNDQIQQSQTQMYQACICNHDFQNVSTSLHANIGQLLGQHMDAAGGIGMD